MQQHSKHFSRRPPYLPLRKGSQVKIQLFQILVMMHIKLTGLTKCSNMAANVLPAVASPFPTTAGDGVKRSKFNFLEHSNVAYQIYWNHKMRQHGSKCFAGRPPSPLRQGMGFKSTFSEHGNFAYQFYWNHEIKQYGSKYRARRPPPFPPTLRSKRQIQRFQNNVMLHIKVTGITQCSNMVANFLPADTPRTQGMR